MAVKHRGRGAGHGSRKTVIGVFTGGGEPAPAAIADLLATAQSDTEVLLEFTPAPGASTHEYRVDAGSAVACDDNFGSQLVGGLTAATEYDFEVRGVNATGSGAWSNVAIETTIGADATAPTLTLPTGFETGPTAATVGATTNEANGTLYYVITTSASAPSAAQVKLGQDHAGAAAADDGSQVILSTGVKTFDATGLSASTAYYAHLMHEDAATNQSAVVSSATFTTEAAPDVTAPTLSGATDTSTGTTTATISVTTDEANGTLYRYLSTSAVAPSAADLKAGTGAVQSGSAAITTTGVKSYNLTGLTAATAYYAHFLHRDAAGNDSAIASGNGFTTSASGDLDVAITPPVLTLAVGATTYPPQFDIALDDTVVVGDTIELEWSDDIRFNTIVDEAANTIDSGEAAANAATFTGLSAISSPAVYYYRARVVQAGSNYSNWSDIVLHGEAVDSTPTAFSFTDVTDVALSTQYTSAAVQITGFNQPVTISVSGGEYATSEDNVTYTAFTSAAGTFYPGDYVKVRHTSSGAYSTATNTVLTAGGVSDTYSTTTEADSVTLPTSGLVLHLEADDAATLFQTITGTTSVADGDPVGTWLDKSTNDYDFTGTANDTTRPTYRAGGGYPYLEFDGTNDILKRTGEALGLYAAGACTVIVALESLSATNTSNDPIIGEFGSSNTTMLYIPFAVTGNDDALTFIRNDANTSIGTISHTLSAFDATPNVLTFTDNGSSIIPYLDGVAGTTRAYTRSGTLTLDQASIGAYYRATTAAAWMGVKIHAIAAWTRVLDSTERADALTYMAAKQGRAL